MAGRETLLRVGSLKQRYDDDDDYEEVVENFKCVTLFWEKINRGCKDLKEFARKAVEMGRSDPRKVIFAAKMGMTLSIVSLLICWKGMPGDISQYSIWAILTVIVMFEFSIGATLIKGFNRCLGTFFAGMLAYGFAELSLVAGKWEQVVIVMSIFLIGFCSSYLKLYPTMKPYEYGFRVFTLTYCILMVAGNRTRQYGEAVVTRLVLIALGASVCLVVNLCVFPIWAGDALHASVVKNFEDLASSLEYCVSGYLKCVEYERIPSKIVTFQAYDDPFYNAYRSVIESASNEDTLLGFAVWEPPHGRFRKFGYPWKNYTKVSGALRHCAFMVMALHGCILSEIQAPPERRQVLAAELERVGREGAKLLRKIGNKLNHMEKLGGEATVDSNILNDIHEAADLLQNKIDRKSHVLLNPETSFPPISRQDSENVQNDLQENPDLQLGIKSLSEAVLDLRTIQWPSRGNSLINMEATGIRTYESASALSLATFASLLIEFVARLQNVVDSYQELSEKAGFLEPTKLESSSSCPVLERRPLGFCSWLFGCFGLLKRSSLV
ncbi:Aluminum-activated malate transporter 9 [Linum grandiflorum]